MRVLVIGAGGHAKVVVDAALAGGHTVAGIVGTSADTPELLGLPISHSAENIDADGFIVAIGDNATRARFFAEYSALHLSPVAIVHPATVLGTDVVVGAGAFLAAGVIVNPGARIGANAILNTGCRVDHDCLIGEHSHIGPGVALCGAVRIGEGTLVGVGSCAAPGASVGDWSVIGAGAAVVGALPERSVCVGVPARVVRATGEPS